MLSIKNLHVRVDTHDILHGLELTVHAGEVHAIMGPNGSGKSTLAHVLAGRDGYEVTAGEVRYAGQDLLRLSPEERAGAGIFLAFQYPVEIPGVSSAYFLRTALNALRQRRGLQGLKARDFLALLKAKMALVEMDQSLLDRAVNAGFSGGEKKRHEILQMAVLEPTLAILDETDSGLDIDALQIVANGVNMLPGARHGDYHPLPAPAALYCAGLRPCALGRPPGPVGWQGTGAGTRGEGVWLDRGTGCQYSGSAGVRRHQSDEP